MRNLAKIYGRDWKTHYKVYKRGGLLKFVPGMVRKSVIDDNKYLRVNGDLRTLPRNFRGNGALRMPPYFKYQDLKAGRFYDVSDHGCSSNSLYSIPSLTISESSDWLSSQTSMKSPNDFNTIHSVQATEQISEYTDLYNKNLLNNKNCSDESAEKQLEYLRIERS